MSRPAGEALSRLIAEVVDARANGNAVPDAEALAERHELDVETVRDALAGLAAIDDLVADPTVPGVQQAPPPKLPDDYEILGELGRGGAGVVYRARQSSLDREVAVKVLRPQDPVLGTALERFGREARALARLRHPHIVSIHEVGEADGALYFTMDLVEGGTLAEHRGSRRRPIPIARAVKLMRQIGGAIGFVHGHGMVHRDLKPANVLIGEQGDAHVVDFGLAVDPTAGATLTATGLLLGTPAYMSPEQARGDRRGVNERTDIYALGVILYELLTGVAPFARRSLVDTVHAVVHEEPDRPRELRPDLPVALERIVMKAMDKDPARRYATASAFVEDLARFEEGRPVAAPPSASRQRVRAFFRRHPDAQWLLSALALFAFLSVLRPAGDSTEGLEAQLASIRQLEEAGQFAAADVLYEQAVADVEGALDVELYGADAVFGALCARLGTLDASGALDGLEQIEQDVDLFAERGERPFETELLRFAIAQRRDDKAAPWDFADERAALKRAMEDQPSMFWRGTRPSEDEGSTGLPPATSMDELRRILDRPDHPLRGPAGLAVIANWTVSTHRFQRELAQDQLWRAWPGWITQAPNTDSDWRLILQDFRLPDPVRGDELADVSEPLRRICTDDTYPADRRRVAFEALCRLHEVPNVLRGTTAPEVEGPEAPTDFDRVRLVVDGIARALEQSPAVRPWTIGRTLLAADGERTSGLTASPRVARWFRRFGFKVPSARGETSRESLEEWWARANRSSPAAALCEALSLEGPVVPDTALRDTASDLVPALTFETNGTRARCMHELLTLAYGDDPRAPQWAWRDGGDGDVPDGLADRWVATIVGAVESEQRSVECLLVRWPGGSGAPAIAQHLALDLRAYVQHESSHEFAALGVVEPLGLFAGDDGSHAEWDRASGTGVTSIKAFASTWGGRPRVTLEMSVRSVPRGAYGPVEDSALWPRVHRVLLESNGPLVVASWLDDESAGPEGARYSLLARFDPSARAPKLGPDLGAWRDALCGALIESVLEPSPGAEPEAALARGLEFVARLLATRPDGPVQSAAVTSLAESVSTLPARVERRGSIDLLTALWALDLVMHPDRPSPFESILQDRTGSQEPIVDLPERFAASEFPSLRAIGLASLRAETRGVTLPEARAIVHARESAGESLDGVPRQIVERARFGAVARYVHPALRVAGLVGLLLAWLLPRGREWSRALVLAYIAAVVAPCVIAGSPGSRLDVGTTCLAACHGLVIVSAARLERAHGILPIASILLAAALVVEQLAMGAAQPAVHRIVELSLVLVASGVLVVVGDRFMGGVLEGAAPTASMVVVIAMLSAILSTLRTQFPETNVFQVGSEDFVTLFGPMAFVSLALLFSGRILLPDPDTPRPIRRRTGGPRRRRGIEPEARPA